MLLKKRQIVVFFTQTQVFYRVFLKLRVDSKFRSSEEEGWQKAKISLERRRRAKTTQLKRLKSETIKLLGNGENDKFQ